MQEPTTRVYLCAHMQTHETGKWHTHVQAYSPAPQAGFPQPAPTGQRYDFLTLASWYFFSLLPTDLLFPLICFLSVLERKDYTAQHTPGTWSHSKFWVLIPPPLYCLSLLLVHVFVRACVYVQTCTSASENLALAAFPDLLCTRREQDSGP